MKKLLFFLCLIALFSCEKEACYVCTTRTFVSTRPGHSQTIYTKQIECGITRAEANRLEDRNGYDVTVVCKKQ